MQVSLDQIKKIAVPILKEAGVTRSAVFGSTARGDNSPDSDIDILVDVPIGTGLFAFAALKRALEQKLKKRVDLVTYNSIDPLLKDNILKEQKAIL